MVMTTTDIETEIATEKETEKQSVTQVDMQQLNEIAVAQSKQTKYHNTYKFEQLKEEFAEIQQNNTDLTSLEEINDNQTQHTVAYLPKKENKNSNSLKNNARFKIFVVCSAICFALSVGLLVYNSVQIAITKMQIASIETQISTGSANYQNALKQLKQLTQTQEMQEQAIDLNMSESQETIQAELIETRAQEIKTQHTNWFNKLCNFLSNLIK